MKWSAETDEKIAALWNLHTITQISVVFGVSPGCIWGRAKKLGLQTKSYRNLLEPTKQEWILAASREARERLIAASAVMAGVRTPKAVAARAHAWKSLLDAHPYYSIAGLARVSGFDHTTILHNLRRLDGVPAKELRHKIVGLSTGRRPIPRLIPAQTQP